MIVAVSLNPAVDKYLRLPAIRPGEHQEAVEAVTSAGGKAVNGAGVLRTLGEEVTLLGIFGGYTGRFLLQEIEREGIDLHAVMVAAPTRTAFVLVEDNGRETEIVEPGAPVAAGEIAALRANLRSWAPRARAVVLSGSAPPGCPADIYHQLIADCAGACPVLLDTSRQWLRAAVMVEGGVRPLLVKPNRREAEDLLGRRLAAPEDFCAALGELQGRGITYPVISDGARGIFAAAGDRRWHAMAPRVEPVNSVGSGDAAVAGFATGLARGLEFTECLRLAIACGTANVLTKECAQVRRDDVERLLPQVAIRAL